MAAAVYVPIIIAAASTALQLLLAPRVKNEAVDKGRFDDIRITSSEYGSVFPKIWGYGRFAGNIVFSTGITHSIIETPTSGGKGVPSAPATRTHVYDTDLGMIVCRGEIDEILRIWGDVDLLTNDANTFPGEALFQAEDENWNNGTGALGSDVLAHPLGGSNNIVTGLGSDAANFLEIDTSGITIPAEQGEPDSEELFTEVAIYYNDGTTREVKIDMVDSAGTTTLTRSFLSHPTWTPHSFNVPGSVDDKIKIYHATSAVPDIDQVIVRYFWRNVFDFESNKLYTGVVDPDIGYPPDLDDPSAYYHYKQTVDAQGEKIGMELPLLASSTIDTFLGTEDQLQNQTIIDWVTSRFVTAGSGDLRVSAMRGLAGFVLAGFRLKAGRVPNFTAEVNNSSNNTALAIIGDVMDEVGITSGFRDTSAITTETQVGYMQSQRQSARETLEPLLRWHSLRLGEIDGKVTVIDEDQSDTAAATAQMLASANNLRGHNYGEAYPDFDAKIITKEEQLLPRQYNVGFMDQDLDYHNNIAQSEPMYDLHGNDQVEQNFPVVSVLSTAQEVANTLHLREVSRDKVFEWSVMPAAGRWAIGTVVELTLNSKVYNVRIEREQRQLPIGVITYQGVHCPEVVKGKFASSGVSTVTQVDNSLAPAYQRYPRNSAMVIIGGDAVRPEDKGKLGIYIGACGRGRGDWENAAIYKDRASGDYQLEFLVDGPAPIGVAQTALGTHTPITTEDTTNTLTIKFYDNITLSSETQSDLDDDPTLNLIRIGDEWVQFRTASSNTVDAEDPFRSSWTISNLWRGRFGTDDAISGVDDTVIDAASDTVIDAASDTVVVSGSTSHSKNEDCMQFTRAVKRFDQKPEWDGVAFNYKAVTNNQNIDVVTAISHTFAAVPIVVDKTADATLEDSEADVYLFDCTSGNLTATLPAAADSTDQIFTIKKIDSTSNTVTIDGNASETIDGSTTKVINIQYDAVKIACDGTEWWII